VSTEDSGFPELNWDEILGVEPSWASVAIEPERAFDNFETYRPKHTNVRIVRGKRSHASSELFGEWAAALQFPYYFGHNWDA